MRVVKIDDQRDRFSRGPLDIDITGSLMPDAKDMSGIVERVPFLFDVTAASQLVSSYDTASGAKLRRRTSVEEGSNVE